MYKKEETSREPVLLVCAATFMELETFWREGETYELTDADFWARHRDIVYALTGVGIPEALGRMLPLAQRLRPARILNIGIAGAYPNSGLEIGDIVIAQSEVYGDVGFELPEEPGFKSIGDSPFGKALYAPGFGLSVDPAWAEPPTGFQARAARGCTVNACSGTERTGLLREKLFAAEFESMEGAAIAQVGQQEQIPVCEVRAISNIAAHRDMRPENIARALAALRCYLQACRVRSGL